MHITEHSLSCQSLCRIWFKHPSNKVLCIIRNQGPRIPIEKLTGPKWRNSTEQNVKDHSRTPDIYFRPVVSFQNLRGHGGVPGFKPGLKKTDSPKSMALSGEFSFLFANRKFSGLRGTYLHNLNDGLRNGGGGPLRVVPPRNDAIEELPSLAELHNQVDIPFIFVGILELHYIGVARQMPHDLHLPPHILNINGGPKLLLRDRLAGEDLPGGLVSAKVGNSELPSAELRPEHVMAGDVLRRGLHQHGELAAIGRAPVIVQSIGVGLRLLLLLRSPLLRTAGGGPTAVPHGGQSQDLISLRCPPATENPEGNRPEKSWARLKFPFEELGKGENPGRCRGKPETRRRDG
ncbi:unnamed protein product [Spirodela intermedia]|uniref:Uncharacterized protein n=1 Tax=Spirodela intermedia TaxID=51605 RepID=A0A7I8JWB6_SPIIN|nr:unnamed protein product [Spirodela intermedia]